MLQPVNYPLKQTGIAIWLDECNGTIQIQIFLFSLNLLIRVMIMVWAKMQLRLYFHLFTQMVINDILLFIFC